MHGPRNNATGIQYIKHEEYKTTRNMTEYRIHDQRKQHRVINYKFIGEQPVFLFKNK